MLEEDDRLVADVSLSVVVRSPELLSPDLTVVTAPRGLLYHQDQAGGASASTVTVTCSLLAASEVLAQSYPVV